jgi:hypothetical protein
MAPVSARSLSDLAWADLVLWTRMNDLWHGLIGIAVLAILFFAVRGLRAQNDSAITGSRSTHISSASGTAKAAKTDFRHADYKYEYDGRSYEFTVRGVDFFMSFATRYGDEVTVIVDPERPETSAILGPCTIRKTPEVT